MMEPRFLRGAALSAQGAFEEAVGCLHEGLAGMLAVRQAQHIAEEADRAGRRRRVPGKPPPGSRLQVGKVTSTGRAHQWPGDDLACRHRSRIPGRLIIRR
jgi:hypothetical protein